MSLPPESTTSPLEAAAPTRARYVVLAFMCGLAFILYLDRVCMGQAEKSIREQFGLSKTEMTWVMMAFTVAYGLFEAPAGRWGDRFGARGVLARIVTWWSLFTALTGATWNLSSLIVCRFLFGAGEAGGFPNTARVLGRWFPDHERGKVQGFLLACSLLGGAVAPPIAALLITSLGWRMAFVVFGALGLVWTFTFLTWFRDNPADHPRVNEAERDHIARGQRLVSAHQSHEPIPWSHVLRSKEVWLLTLIQNTGAFGQYIFITWYPTYLKEARREGLLSWLPTAESWAAAMGRPTTFKPDEFVEVASGVFCGLVLSGGVIGCLIGGWYASRIVHWGWDRRWSRRLWGFAAMTMGAIAVVAGTKIDLLLPAVLLTSLACMGVQMQQASWWGVTQEISGRHVGSLFGLMNGAACFGVLGSQRFFGWFSDMRMEMGLPARQAWDPGFWLDGMVLFLGACFWLFLDPTRSAVGEDSGAAAESKSDATS